jgi:hypothetical protein
MIVVIMLIYTISFILQLPACIAIHNQCSNIMLETPVYFCNGTMRPKLFDRQISVNCEARISFEIDTIKNKFECILLFKLKRHAESDNQQNMNTSIIETNKNEAPNIHMLVIWEVKNAKSFTYVTLIEDTKAFTWDEDKLKKLYDKNCDWLKKYNTVSDIWFVNDNTTLKMTSNLKDFELSISISEEGRNGDVMMPFCIDPKR